MRNVPEPHRHREMRSRKSSFNTEGSIKRPKRSLGFKLETMLRARSISPLSVTTPTARPDSTTTSRTGLDSRISTPRSRAALAIAWVIAPMPPMAWPQAPFLPFTSPKT